MSNLNPLGFLRHHHDIWDAMRLDLNLDEEALLARLFDIMHRDGGAIPNDPVWLSKACRVNTRTVNRILPKLLSHGFILTDAGGKLLSATYIEAELQNAEERSSRGKRAAATRWRADRKSDAKIKSSADERPSNRGSSGVKSKFDNEKENENNNPSQNGHYRRDIDGDLDREGAPMEPPSSTDNSSGYDTDAHVGASGHDQPLLSKGDRIKVGTFGICIVDDFGLIGRSRWVKARRSDNNDQVFVPVNESDRLMVNDAM
jgi:uncharacterized protein YdaU (DUF1376 family)